MSSSGDGPNVARELLSAAFEAKDAEQIFVEKVKRKPLYLRPTNAGAEDGRQRRRRERERRLSLRKQRQKPRPLSAKEKRDLALYVIPREAQKYAIYEPLHRMWIGYIHEILFDTGHAGGGGGGGGLPVKPATAARFCSADFHGAELEVVRARCVSRVGLKGIVVRDTKFAFEIITRKNQVKLIPKEHCIFQFEVPHPTSSSSSSSGVEPQHEDGTVKVEAGNGARNLVFQLHGSRFENRAPDRANKKFKQKNLIDV